MTFSRQPGCSRSESRPSPALRSIEMNEKGVCCVQQRQYEEAITCFGSALRTLNEILSSHTLVGEPALVREETDQGVAHGDAILDPSRGAETLPSNGDEKLAATDLPIPSADDRSCGGVSTYSRNPQAMPTNANSTHPQAVLEDHTSVIYTESISIFKFLIRSRVVATLLYNDVVEMSISVMFNFALAHHLHSASGQCENPEKVMDQAVALYELTHSLQLQEGIELSLEYTMGTICNLGHIHRLRGDTEKSTKCFQHLLSIFCFLQCQNSLEVQHSDSAIQQVGEGAGGQPDDRFESSSSCLRRLLESDVIFCSVSYLFLSDSAAAAA
jgi:tetratricopeptide (TPR) repeat protein